MVVQFVFKEKQHGHALQPIWEAVAREGVEVQVTNNPTDNVDLYVFPVDWMIRQMPDEMYDKVIWIDHGIGRTKPNVPFDEMTKIRLCLVESEWTKNHCIENISTPAPGWRSGEAEFTRDNIKVVGYPSNDTLWEHKNVEWKMPAVPTILYAPTWSINPPDEKVGWIGSNRGNLVSVGQHVIQTSLIYGSTVYVKQHELGTHLEPPIAEDCVFVHPACNVSPLLRKADILITDCSSTAAEFAVLGRPIIEVVDGINGSLLMNVGEQTRAANLDKAIEKVIKNPASHASKRQKWVKRTNYVHDSNAAKRAAEAIVEELSSG